MSGTIADHYLDGVVESSPSVKHLIEKKTWLRWYEKGRPLSSLCGKDVTWEEATEPSRTCSLCVGKASQQARRRATRA